MMAEKQISRRTFIKGLAAGAVSVAALGVLQGCESSSPSSEAGPASASKYTPGTYTATAQGMGLVTVTMKFDENSILDVELDVSEETESIGQAAADTLRQQLLDHQSSEIDGVSGATITSTAVRRAAAECIAQASGIPIPAVTETQPAQSGAEKLLAGGVELDLLKDSVVVEEPITDFAGEHTYDVVVIGAGTAGIPAALAASQEGASVAVLQKADIPVAQGNVGACILLDQSTEMGIAQYLHEMQVMYNYRCDFDLTKEYVLRSGEAWDWYTGLLDQAGFDGYSEKESMDHVYSEGNCFVKGNFFPDSMSAPTAALAEWAETQGIEFFYGTPAVQLIVENGAVTGAVGKAKDGSYLKFNAKKGVILATGDYQNNDAMKVRYCPDSVYFAPKQSGKTGDGQLMGMLAGAQMENTVHCKMIHAAGASVMRNEPLLAVNADGKRFHAEDVLFEYRNTLLRYQPGHCMYSLFDGNYHDQVVGWGGDPDRSTVGNASPEALAGYVEKGVVVQADTLEELCEAVGLPVEETVASVKRYNELCAAGHDLDFGKESKYMQPVDTAPFYCNKREYQISALPDGLLIDTNGQCKDAAGELIPGLFAAGNCSGCFYGNVDYSLFTMGMSVGRCVTFGYLTGRYVANL